MKKFAMKLVMVVLIFSMCTGCKSGGKGIGTSSGSGSGADKEDATLKIMTVDRANLEHSIAKKSLITTEIEKRTKTHIVWDAIPESNYAEIMNTRLAAGINLPDIMFTGYSKSLKPAQNGLFIELNSLIDQYAPNLKKVLDEEFPLIKKLNVDVNGKLYWVPGITQNRYEGKPISSPRAVSIRKDWLDKCGITKVPETTTEFYNALKAFQAKDCNGNGKADEVLVSWFGFQDAMLAWFDVPQGSITIDKNGNAVYIWANKNTYEYVKYMRKLYTEKLIDQQIFNRTGENIIPRVQANTAAAICYYSDASNFDSQAGVEGAEYVTMNPLKTDIGTSGSFLLPSTGLTDANWAITKDCKDKVAAMKFLDWFYSQDARNMVVWGIEGVHCTKTATGFEPTADFLKRVLDSKTTSIDDVYDWVPSLPFCRITNWEDTEGKTVVNEKAKARAAESLRLALWSDQVIAVTQIALPTEDEEKKSTQYANEMGTYAIETITTFINGRKELNETTWNEFQNRLFHDFHLQERLDIFKAQYDRVKK